MQQFKLTLTVGCMALACAILAPVANADEVVTPPPAVTAATAAPPMSTNALPATAGNLPLMALLGLLAWLPLLRNERSACVSNSRPAARRRNDRQE